MRQTWISCLVDSETHLNIKVLIAKFSAHNAAAKDVGWSSFQHGLLAISKKQLTGV
jgi:hypothetical protein